ncbi:MAG: type III-B CRISPR module RAMP protein Cmr1 [Limisphaerales bacterium]
MKREIYSLELITPCFAGGAEPEKQAEIRAPAIRGQLRWWFRVLGGFASLSPLSVRAQEERIFGSAAGDAGVASPLIVRIRQSLVSKVVKDADQLGASMNSDRGYLLFPLRSNPRRNENKGRGVFDGTLPTFDLELVWRGNPILWDDIRALAAIFGHLGSLGFRSRRAMGALAFGGTPPDLLGALKRFAKSDGIIIRSMPSENPNDAIAKLARWLKGWRAFGRTADHPTAQPPNPPHNAGFAFAKADHDAGVEVVSHRHGNRPTNRPALGLPILQFFSSRAHTVKWEQGRGSRDEPKGRFASPVLLRPHRDAKRWRALVIFVESRRWNTGRPVYLDGQSRSVALDLYEAMKKDSKLSDFP